MARILIIDDDAPIRSMLRQDFPTTKIMAISGGGYIGHDHFLTIAERLGVQCALQKPFGLQDMINAVEEMLQKHD